MNPLVTDNREEMLSVALLHACLSLLDSLSSLPRSYCDVYVIRTAFRMPLPEAVQRMPASPQSISVSEIQKIICSVNSLKHMPSDKVAS